MFKVLYSILILFCLDLVQRFAWKLNVILVSGISFKLAHPLSHCARRFHIWSWEEVDKFVDFLRIFTSIPHDTRQRISHCEPTGWFVPIIFHLPGNQTRLSVYKEGTNQAGLSVYREGTNQAGVSVHRYQAKSAKTVPENLKVCHIWHSWP